MKITKEAYNNLQYSPKILELIMGKKKKDLVGMKEEIKSARS